MPKPTVPSKAGEEMAQAIDRETRLPALIEALRDLLNAIDHDGDGDYVATSKEYDAARAALQHDALGDQGYKHPSQAREDAEGGSK